MQHFYHGRRQPLYWLSLVKLQRQELLQGNLLCGRVPNTLRHHFWMQLLYLRQATDSVLPEVWPWNQRKKDRCKVWF